MSLEKKQKQKHVQKIIIHCSIATICLYGAQKGSVQKIIVFTIILPLENWEVDRIHLYVGCN